MKKMLLKNGIPRNKDRKKWCEGYVYIMEVVRDFVCGRRRDTRYPFERRAGIKTDSSSSALRMSS